MMRNRKARNQILMFLCAAVTLLTIYTMMELWKIQISKALHLEYALLRRVPGYRTHISESDRAVFEQPVPAPAKKSPQSKHNHNSLKHKNESDTTLLQSEAPPQPKHGSPKQNKSDEPEDWPLPDPSLLTVATAPSAAAASTPSVPSTTPGSTSTTTTPQWIEVNGVVPTPEWTSNMSAPFYIYPKPRNDTSISVHIVIVVVKGTPMQRYATARQSVECYGALHNYTVAVMYDDRYPACAVHKDIFFKRHCNVHLYMKEKMAEDSWLLFIDGDVGVVNPRVLIEEYIQPGYEIYLFDRFWNWEFAALSYLVKNNDRGRAWVNGFATFEFQLPKSHHGTDNGALHPFMMFYLVPETRNETTRSRMSSLCLSIWNRSRSWDDVFAMEACVRTVIGERLNFLEHKGYGWSRDLWTLHSHWTDDDFMMHAVKEHDLKPYPDDENERRACHISTLAGAWDGLCGCIFPVLSRLNTTQCEASCFYLIAGEPWLMEGRLQLEPAMKRKILDRMANQILKSQMTALGNASGKILNL